MAGNRSLTQYEAASRKRLGVSAVIILGVLPALIVYSVGRRTWLRAAACGAYALCALIRLAWFNVDEEARQDFDTGRRKVYLGLPVTSAAAVFPLLSLVCHLCRWPFSVLSLFVLLLAAAAFLTPFSIRKPSLSVRRKPKLRGSRRSRRRRKKDANA